MNSTDDNITTNKMDIPPVNPNRRKVKRVENNFFKQLIICIACVFVLSVILYHKEIKNIAYNIIHIGSNVENSHGFHFGARRQNILLMGVDVSDDKDHPFENTRSDSIYLISIAPHAKNVNVISIPRDSKVYIHGKAYPDKINHAFAYGGIDASVKTIEQTLGVRIHHYIVVSNTALVEFIDKIGGVDVYVEKDMHYNDYSGKLHINLSKGMQHLDGKDAEGFMRYRKDALGDIGRIRRQQWFLNAVADKLKDPAIILKIPEALKSASKYIQTDFSFYELAQYAALIKSIDLSQVKVATLPGEPSQRGVVSYWILDPKEVQDVVNLLVYGEKPKALNRPLEAGILYTASEEEHAKALQKELEALNITVNLREAKYLGHDHIAIHSFDVPNEALLNIKSEISELKNKQTVYDIIGINKAAKDFTIVLAGS